MAKNNDLRIISGHFRGQSLKSPESSLTHPMGAREKLALFNMVNVEQEIVLDAFAGSGALGIEALSRGAKEVVFVEQNRAVSRILRQNLQNLSLDSPIFTEKVSTFTQNPDFSQYFTVIFADPPYDKINLAELNSLYKVLAPNGILALSSPKEQGSIELEGLRISSLHTYARAQITLYRKITSK